MFWGLGGICLGFFIWGSGERVGGVGVRLLACWCFMGIRCFKFLCMVVSKCFFFVWIRGVVEVGWLRRWFFLVGVFGSMLFRELVTRFFLMFFSEIFF